MNDWPLLKSYKDSHLSKIALPLGGIGTGTVSLGGRGNLQDWAIMNRPAVGYTPILPTGLSFIGSFFALHCDRNGSKKTIMLEGPIDKSLYESNHGSEVIGAGLPRFRENSFSTSYPLAKISFKDGSLPLDVELEAYNPLIPGDEDLSGLPLAIFRYKLSNTSKDTVKASICGNLLNFIGADGTKRGKEFGEKEYGLGAKNNQIEFREGKGVKGIFLSSNGVDALDESWGTMALSCASSADVSHRTGWAPAKWGRHILEFWDDFSANGRLDNNFPYPGDAFNVDQMNTPMGSLNSSVEIPAGETRTISFILSWHFPNRKTWTPQPSMERDGVDYKSYNIIGNHYCNLYRDAWDVAESVFPNLNTLEDQTIKFVSSVVDSDLPDVIKEAALFNISTLRTQTCFRTQDGRFFGWEGIHKSEGSCFGNCTHVWNYEQTTAFLFPKLSRSMRDTEFNHSLYPDGGMAFRVKLPLDMNQRDPWPTTAADGQMGTLMKLYRDWILSGDDEFLTRLWPNAKKAMSYCWLEGGWDDGAKGWMDGAQHNTMDVEYYGPNPQMQCWYLGALLATSQMALRVGDSAFSEKCQMLYEKGRQWMDEHLFNGEYYEQIIQIPKTILPSTNLEKASTPPKDPPFQIGKGCLVDQLVGQFMAHVCGLGHLLNKDHVKTTLESIMKYNFQQDFHDHFNPMRSYVLGDESALIMASYPLGERPKQPFPYYAEVMTGFEYSTAIHMLYEGLEEDGLRVITSIRDRYDGQKRNPFDEAECGHHYARAMAAWGLILQWTGFHYNGIEQSLSLADREGVFPWCIGDAWGQYVLRTQEDKLILSLKFFKGSLELNRVTIGGHHLVGPFTGIEGSVLELEMDQS